MNIPIKSILLASTSIVVLGAACTSPALINNQNTASPASTETWVMSNLAAIPGKYADADVVTLADGTYRMYYATEPEVFSEQHKPIYSALSVDGVHWATDEGTRITEATFPDVIQLSNHTWRMYFQGVDGLGLKSASSTDGLTWTLDEGVRIPVTGESISAIENVGAPTTTQLADGSFVMVYRGTINQQFSQNVPNSNTQLFFWATSADGLTWEKQGLAIDSRNSTLEGLADGPDWVKWSDGSLRLYFWGYQGVYVSTFEDNSFSPPVLSLATPNPAGLMYPPNPPGDPSIIKVEGTWFMYYGFHEQGIYYATLPD